MKTGYEKKTLRFEKFAFHGAGGGKSGSTLPVSESRNCAGFDGAAARGIGLTPFLWEGEQVGFGSYYPDAAFYFALPTVDESGERGKKFGFVSTEGTLFLRDASQKLWDSKYAFGSPVQGTVAVDKNGEAYLLLAGKTGVFSYTEAEGVSETDVREAVNAICTFGGRTFCAIAPRKLVYGRPFEPKNFAGSIDGGGEIETVSDRGEIRALVPTGERLLVFFDYGIFALEGLGSARDFTLREIPYGGGRIFPASVAVCGIGGEKTVFLSENGLFALCGNTVRSICENLRLKPKREGQVCVHAVFNGQYYLCFTEENGEKQGLIADIEKGQGYFAFAEETAGNCGQEAVCRGNTFLQRFCETGELPDGESAFFRVDNFDFYESGEKTLRSILLRGVGRVKATISCGNRKRTKILDLDEGERTLRSDLRGRKFTMEFVLEKRARVTGLQAELVLLKGNAERRFGSED